MVRKKRVKTRLTSGTLKLIAISPGREEDEAEGLRTLLGELLVG